MKVLVTGANGFVGSHIVDALLRHGHTVHAMVRPTSNLAWLEGKEVHRVHGHLDRPETLQAALEGIDAVIHNAGVVSAPTKYHYYMHNTEGTHNLVKAALVGGRELKRFVFVSSQAAGGPSDTATPRREEDAPLPITAYGHSKLLAENLLRRYRDQLPISIIRPPAVYGPRDAAFLPMFKMVERGWMPLFGTGREVSLIHAQDLARQVLLQLTEEAAIGQVFHAAPYDPVSLEQFGQTMGKVLGNQPRPLQLPDGLLKHGYPLVYPAIRALGIRPPFQVDKLPDMLARRWTISGEKARRLLGFEGRFPLLTGVGQTAEWYRWKGWLTTRRDRLKRKKGGEAHMRFVEDTMRLFDPACDLCGLTFDGEYKTKKHYEDDDFVIVDCLICRVPMAVLKEHRAQFTASEKERLLKIFSDLFGNDATPDFEQRRIPEHAHVHYRTGLHAPPWVRRPE